MTAARIMYRPVSLLCPAIKILERLLLPTLQENLQIPDFQHGFRKKTLDCLRSKWAQFRYIRRFLQEKKTLVVQSSSKLIYTRRSTLCRTSSSSRTVTGQPYPHLSRCGSHANYMVVSQRSTLEVRCQTRETSEPASPKEQYCSIITYLNSRPRPRGSR